MKLETTHIIMTQADKGYTNGVSHCFKFGTEVMWLGNTKTHVKVVNANGSVQFVTLNDLRVATK